LLRYGSGQWKALPAHKREEWNARAASGARASL
jgi:hypothetical protein